MEFEDTATYLENTQLDAPQNYQSILEAFKNNSSGFFIITLVYGIITGILGCLLIL